MGKLPVATKREQAEGLMVLAAMVGIMWVLQAINAVDSQRLDNDGLYARNVSHLWGILTSPFLHAGWTHLIDNTIPFVFMGAIIALRGAIRLIVISVIIIILGGLGTWLISPSGVVTVGASGMIFGYATYLFARGFFDKNLFELFIGVVVGVIWGGALLSSIVPHTGVSWQGHVCGALAGVVAAWFLARHDGEFDKTGEREAVAV